MIIAQPPVEYIEVPETYTQLCTPVEPEYPSKLTACEGQFNRDELIHGDYERMVFAEEIRRKLTSHMGVPPSFIDNF